MLKNNEWFPVLKLFLRQKKAKQGKCLYCTFQSDYVRHKRHFKKRPTAEDIFAKHKMNKWLFGKILIHIYLPRQREECSLSAYVQLTTSPYAGTMMLPLLTQVTQEPSSSPRLYPHSIWITAQAYLLASFKILMGLIGISLAFIFRTNEEYITCHNLQLHKMFHTVVNYLIHTVYIQFRHSWWMWLLHC